MSLGRLKTLIIKFPMRLESPVASGTVSRCGLPFILFSGFVGVSRAAHAFFLMKRLIFILKCLIILN